MKTSVKVAFGISMVWIIVTLIVFLLGYSRQAFVFGIMINLFCLLVSISLALFFTKREKNYDESFFLDDFKIALQGGIVYALLISGFIYVYHEYIDSSIKDALVADRIEALHKVYPDEASYLKLQAVDSKWKDKSFDDFIENQEDQTRGIISSFSVFVFHLMGLFIFSMFFAFFATIIMRKIILKQ